MVSTYFAFVTFLSNAPGYIIMKNEKTICKDFYRRRRILEEYFKTWTENKESEQYIIGQGCLNCAIKTDCAYKFYGVRAKNKNRVREYRENHKTNKKDRITQIIQYFILENKLLRRRVREYKKQRDENRKEFRNFLNEQFFNLFKKEPSKKSSK